MTALHSDLFHSFSNHMPCGTMSCRPLNQDWRDRQQAKQQKDDYNHQAPLLMERWICETQSTLDARGWQPLPSASYIDPRTTPEMGTTYMLQSVADVEQDQQDLGPSSVVGQMDPGIVLSSETSRSGSSDLELCDSTPKPRFCGFQRPSNAEVGQSASISYRSAIYATKPCGGSTSPALSPCKSSSIETQCAISCRPSTSGLSDDSNPSTDTETPTKTIKSACHRRKRQRLPHTAVERHYRENLKAHIESLRQKVPLLSWPVKPNAEPSSSLLPDGPRRSKCDVLKGAIDYISVIERANTALENEIEVLKAQVSGLQALLNIALPSPCESDMLSVVNIQVRG